MSKIGFVGLGIMGTPMAEHLIKGGHELYLFSIPSVPASLVEAGGKACASGKEVAQKADIVFIMVPDTPHVAAALFDANGVAAGLSPGKIVVDMSSISPVETKVFAKQDQCARMRLSRRPGLRRRGGRQGGEPDDHGWRPRRRVREGEATVRADGQERHAGGRQR